MLSLTPERASAADTGGEPVFEGLTRKDGRPLPRTMQTVLLVDDDDALREVMEARLGMTGYVVMPCSDAQSASRTFQAASVDLLLTDLQMPGRSGVELARELTELRPTLPVVIVSGSILSEELTDEIERRNWKFIAKPCSMTQLLGTMHTLISTSPKMQLFEPEIA